MNVGEHERMALAAESHWWYRGLREAIVNAVRRYESPARPMENAIDAGCGTGENLRALQQVLPLKYAGGFDVSPLALNYAAEKCPGADLYLSDICRPQLHVAALDLVLSCDVLSVPGFTKALPGLQMMTEALRPGGLFIVNLPAYSWLRSRHDAAVQQSYRFCAHNVRTLMSTLQLKIELLTYRVWTLFPAIVLYRMPSAWCRQRNDAGPSDVSVPPSLWNRILTTLLHAENQAVEYGVRFPWGSSVFVVARKPVRC